MTIHLKPELEALIREDVERGPYESAMSTSLKRFRCCMPRNDA
jgi:hypothetical protein